MRRIFNCRNKYLPLTLPVSVVSVVSVVTVVTLMTVGTVVTDVTVGMATAGKEEGRGRRRRKC